MQPELPSNELLEQRVTRQLRSLPPRRAPHDLQVRVFAELQRRAAVSWWQQAFSAWPFIARFAFVLLCMGVANIVVSVTRWTSGLLSDDVSRPLNWAERAVDMSGSIVNFLMLLLRHAPTPWLVGGALVIAAMYAVLLGLGATAYRALNASR